MKRKYANLRLESLRNAAGPAAVGAALLLDPGQTMAGAVVQASLSVHAGGATWYISNSTSVVSGAVGLGIDTVSISGQYQGYYGSMLTVNGTVFKSPAGIADLTETTLTSGPITMSGLNTTVQYYFDPATPTVRTVYSFTNPTASPITVTIQWQNYVGSPIVATSSVPAGTSNETAADRWVITSTNSFSPPPSPPPDPYVDSVRYGPGASNTPAIVQAPSTSGSLIDQYSLTAPAGQTRLLMFFVRISQTQSAALTASGTFNSTNGLASAGLLNGLTVQQESEIVNWSFPQTSSVPAMGAFGLLLMGALLGAMGVRYLRWPVGGR